MKNVLNKKKEIMLDDQFEKFVELLEEAKKFKVPVREKTFFDTAIRNHYENPTTELLAFFLNPLESHELGDTFWSGFCDVVIAESKISSKLSLGQIENLEREAVTHNSNRIDLMIETGSFLFLLEAKIYHQQHNPFEDYIEHAENRRRGRQILGLILSISGDSEVENWYGISYQQLINAVRPYLAEQIQTNPMNKWSLFAREFLLHLESYYRIQNLDMNRVQFIFDHYQEIQALQKLKTSTINEVVSKISQQLNQSIDDYDSENKYESWGGIRFYNRAWSNRSNTTLFIKEYQGRTVFDVTTYILNLPQEFEEQVLTLLKAQQDSRFLKWHIEGARSQNERWLCIFWRVPENTFEAIESLILEKASLLDMLEKTFR